jgi:hypothetical protein
VAVWTRVAGWLGNSSMLGIDCKFGVCQERTMNLSMEEGERRGHNDWLSWSIPQNSWSITLSESASPDTSGSSPSIDELLKIQLDRTEAWRDSWFALHRLSGVNALFELLHVLQDFDYIALHSHPPFAAPCVTYFLLGRSGLKHGWWQKYRIEREQS